MNFNEATATTNESANVPFTEEVDFGIQNEEPNLPDVAQPQQQQPGVGAEVAAPQQPVARVPKVARAPTPAVEAANNEKRNLRDRRQNRRPEFFGCPVSYLAEVIDIAYDEAINGPYSEHWRLAILEELQALQTCNIWTPSKLPPGRRAVKSRWVFSKKLGLNGEVVRFNTRLVAKGYLQQEFIDYSETFAPVVRPESIRFLLALAAARNLEIYKFDVRTAFLNGIL